uniref:Vacuolar protein sorting-associated protein 18 homolog n=1 Tax=Panagrolaimus sp. ES5 TaxID=591445 RepID=A0AC34FWM3_9BILA
MIQHVRIQTGKKTDIPLTLATNDFISELFLDGTGSHCIVSTNNGENFYIHLKTLKPINLKKAKGHVITAIGWNIEYGTNTDTSFILVGTATGSIFETNIASNGTVQYFKLLTETISTNKLSPISDISLSMITTAKNDKWVAFICYPGQLHILTATMNTVECIQQQTGTFVGTFVEPQNAILSSMFSKNEALRHRYVNQGPKSCSAFSLNTVESGVIPTRYFWANEEGISIGSVDLAKDVESYDLIEEKGFIKHERHNGLMNYPLMVEMSEFHIIALYRNQIAAYSAYNYKKYFEEIFEDAALKVMGMSRDTSSQMLWVFTNQSMWKYKPNNEKRYAFKVT